ncbi:hypothetical protein LXL04_025204 [Taraxacum kok-saghyz]
MLHCRHEPTGSKVIHKHSKTFPVIYQGRSPASPSLRSNTHSKLLLLVGCAGGGIGGRRWDRRFPPRYTAPPSLFSPSLRSSHSRLWQSELLPSLQSATTSAYEIVAAAAIAANPGEIPHASSSPSLEPVGLHPPVRGLHPRAIPDSVSFGCSSKSEPSPLTDLVSSLDDLRLYREVTLVPSIS